MNDQMAYLLGMILGNGTIQRGSSETNILIDLPHKNLIDDEGRDVHVYVKASLVDIKNEIEPLLSSRLKVTSSPNGRSTTISFTKPNEDYAIREILSYIGNGNYHNAMVMDRSVFDMKSSEKTELLRGFADVTGYIRKSNLAFGQPGHHRVYIEIPGNWQTVIDIANLLKDLDIPVQTIDFGHPNFRDSNLKKYNEGKPNYWKKEHQIKIWANEFLPVGFNIEHKQKALEKYAAELLKYMTPDQTHKFYWEKGEKAKEKARHPGENDDSLPITIRGKHYNSWQKLAKDLGYGK